MLKKIIYPELYRYSGTTYSLASLIYWVQKAPGLEFLLWIRLYQHSKFPPFKFFCHLYLRLLRILYGFQFSPKVQMGKGFYIGHHGTVVINAEAVFGKNCNIGTNVIVGKTHKKRTGSPVFGDEVWIGSNSVIVGKINIGNNVVIAPNAFVNVDVPSNSVAIGNPVKIIPKENATESIINRKFEE
tara:strand:- start:4976 stop:5530 length:555 start_codon:yes stop_codon:yes gene_type:complete